MSSLPGSQPGTIGHSVTAPNLHITFWRGSSVRVLDRTRIAAYTRCMSKRDKQGSENANEIAFRGLSDAVGEGPPIGKKDKLAAAVELGRMGGLKGGKARAERMTAEQRSDNARHAAKARWERKAQGEH